MIDLTPDAQSASSSDATPDTKDAPAAIPLSKSPERFINRELSWLAFNWRVLEEADNADHPLLERLRFLSISANNLDEFFMVRYAGLREQLREGITKTSRDGLTPKQQVQMIEDESGLLQHAQTDIWRTLKAELETNGIILVKPDSLSNSEKKWLDNHFNNNILPLLTPLAIDPALPFPFIPNEGFALATKLTDKTGDEQIGVIQLPPKAARFIRLPEKAHNITRFIAIEDLIGEALSELFAGFSAQGVCLFKVIRDSDIELEDEAQDLLEAFEDRIKQRRRGKMVRLIMQAKAPGRLGEFILRQLHAEPRDVVLCDDMIGFQDLSQLIVKDRPELVFEPYEPRFPERIKEMQGDHFAAIRAKDILIHHPYESFDVVVDFLRQAANDPDVLAIKQTLYRTTPNSPIIGALIKAAESGKAVTALVEIKARFDEETNIQLARDLERAGVQVVFGFIDYKTHAKVSLVIRREGGELKTYTHFGTGNYHPITARIYTDLALFTADEALGRDAGRMFNYITAHRSPPDTAPDLESLGIAPATMLQDLLRLINNEAQAAKRGKPSGIWAKMNALVDHDIIDALYSASQAGVPITLVVRGICSLRPGVEGLSENIQVKSIVGRFLEHTRLVCFANGAPLPHADAKVFISSADWMQRNLRKRVEALIPIENETVHRQILNQIMTANINDNVQSWYMQPDGSYVRAKPKSRKSAFVAHDYFMENPSLSGRGKALKVSNPPRLAKVDKED